jgi:proteasome lid subunit RPN8/RPN11
MNANEQRGLGNKRKRKDASNQQGVVATLPLKMLYSSLVFASKQARQAAKDNGREICGLLINNGYFIELVHVRNKCKTGGGFAFYVNEIRAIKKMTLVLNHEIIGTFHSHPVGLAEPGKSDIYYAVNDSLMLIFDVFGKKYALWHIQDKKAKPVQFDIIEEA